MPWIPSVGIEWHDGVDGISLALLVLTAIVFLTGVLVMWELEERVKEFFAFMTLLVTGVFGVFVSLDLFFFLFFYEVAVLPMYLLIAIWGSTRKEYGAMKLTLYLLAGTALVVPAALALYWRGGPQHLRHDAAGGHRLQPQLPGRSSFPFLFLGFGILAGLWPLPHLVAGRPRRRAHRRLDAARRRADEARRLRHPAGRRCSSCPRARTYWAHATAVLATVNIVYGAFVALAQTDLKFVIGYSLGLAHGHRAARPRDAVGGRHQRRGLPDVQPRHHDGPLLRRGGLHLRPATTPATSRSWAGCRGTVPVASAFFIVAALTGAGVPGFASFWAELLVFLGTLRTYPVLAAIVVVALIVTLAYSIRVIVVGVLRRAARGAPARGGHLLLPRGAARASWSASCWCSASTRA